ncbi:hypothetical protein D9619_009484 [Psilocybe cf. subviscida]|uniref:Uncharacterized protein n=1 Tax=Psilocybe cf. subviscida TaxID=2480587 RepID=A0A8H5BWM2_9AGAR|nr:hypothetical protein D9619_009484 [Psilocybe cf. subviscida]
MHSYNPPSYLNGSVPRYSRFYNNTPVTATPHTLFNLRIEGGQGDEIFEAVRRGELRLFTQPLTPFELSQIGHGCVYVWEQSDSCPRWYDGRFWYTASMDKIDHRMPRIRLYEEVVPPNGTAPRNVRPDTKHPRHDLQQYWDSKPDGLRKQEYSATVYVTGEARPRKWHLLSYFLQDEENDWRLYNQLCSIKDIPFLRNVQVPHNTFLPYRLPVPVWDDSVQRDRSMVWR